MTQQEFDTTKWKCGMKAVYKGEVYPVASCDFEERLVGLYGVALGTDDHTWVRCENVAIVDA